MKLFSKLKSDFFSAKEQEEIKEAIRHAEKKTSGEIRIFIDHHEDVLGPLEKAEIVFYHLKMEAPVHRNAVLIYIALKNKTFALYGDQGIHERVGSSYWNRLCDDLGKHFREDYMRDGLIQCINELGIALSEHFPYECDDKNELPEDIIFGHDAIK